MSFADWSEKKKKEKEQGTVAPKTASFSEWTAEKKASSIDEAFINTFISDANSFLSSAEKDFGALGWGNASSSYEAKRNSWLDLETRASYIRRWLDNNKDRLGSETYKSFQSALDDFNKGASSAVDSFKSANEYYSQFKTEYEYKDAVKLNELYSMSSDDILKHINRGEEIAYTTSGGQNVSWQRLYDKKKKTEEAEALYSSLSSGGDWEEYVNKGASIENPTFDEAQGWFNIGGWHIGEKDVNNIVTFSRENYDAVAMGDMFSSNPNSTIGDFRYGYMTDNEVSIYNYYLAKFGEEKASEYLESLDKELTDRHESKIVEAWEGVATDAPVLSSIFSVGMNLFSGAEYLGDTIKYLATGELDDNVLAQQSSTIRGTVSANTDWMIGNWDLHDFLYNTGMSAADSLTSMTLLGNAGGIALGLSAAAQGANDALARGMSNKQAFWSGLASGVFEGLFETVSIGQFNALKEGATTTFKQFAKNIGKSMLVNASEETLTEIANIAYDWVANGDFSQYETSIRQYMQSGMSESEAKKKVALELGAQVVESGASGALMGFGFGAVGSGGNYIAGSLNAKEAYGTGRTLVDETLERASEGSDARVLAEAFKAALDGGKTLSGGKLYKLATAYDTDITNRDTAKIKSAVEARLTELGENGDIGQLSEIIAKHAKGEKLTSAEESVIRSSYAGQRVANEVTPKNIASGKYTSEWAEKIGTERINAGAYNKGLYDLAMEQAGVAVSEEMDSATVDSTPTEKIATEAKNTVSDDGKTVLIDTNEEVEIQGIASIENGKVKLRTNKGEVDAENISFGTGTEALLYEAVTDMTAEAARNMIESYDPTAGVSTSDYIHGFKDSYKYGFFGFAETELAKGTFTKDLSEAQRHIAYTVGKNAGEAVVKEAQKARTEAKEKGDNAAPKKGKVFINGKEYNLGDKTGLRGIRDDSVKGTAALTHSIGVKTYFYESYLDKNGNRVYRDADGTVKKAPHGFYDPTDGSIHIDLNAGKMGEGVILYTVAHEMTHFIRDWSPAKFKVFADFLLENYAKKGVSVEALVQGQIQKAAKNGRELSFDEAYEEVVADSCQAMLADGNAIKKIADLKAKDATLWQKIKDFISGIVAKIKKAYAGLDPYSDEGRFVKNQLDNFEQLQSMWVDALVDAGETYSAVRDALGEDSTIKVNEDGEFLMGKTADGKVLLNDRTWDEGGREILRATLALEGYSEEDIKAAMTIMDGKHALVEQLNKEFIEQDKISKATLTTDLKTGKAILSALVSNGDYPVNIDLLMVCKKRQAYQRVINRLCETGLIKQATLDSLAIAEINKILGKYGFETACLGCFVESRRIRIQEWAETICKEWNGIVDKMVGKGKAENFNFASETFVKDLSEAEIEDLSNDLDAAYERDGLHYGRMKVVKKMEQLLREVPSLRKRLSVADLITPQGRTHLKQLSSELNSLVACRYGSNTPKIVQDFNPYNHELAQYGTVPTKYKSLREYLYAIGGARMQSFSDFIVENWFDYCQIVADLAARKLPMHTYTKEIVLAKLFGMTGIKINLSLIPDIDKSMGKEYAGLTRNAKGELELIWGDKDRYKATGGKSYMQSINFADAIELMADPRYSANVGTIAVGVSDMHIRMMLDDPRIRMIIPYHSSGMNPIFANLVGTEYYNDYTNDQNPTVKQLYDSNGNAVSLKLEKSQKDNLVSGFDFNAVLQELGDARAAAKAYLEWCADASKHSITIKGETYTAVLKPEFEQFSDHENYYKVLEDFNTYDCITEQAAPQGDVQQIYPDEFEDILRGELTVRENYRQKQEPKWDAAMGEIESYLKKHTKKETIDYAKEHGIKLSKKDMKLSDRDSEGNALTEAQQEFFKDSKVRDSEGRLTPVYHGTPTGGFTEFQLPFYLHSLTSAEGAGYYFTDKANASQYMKGLNGKSVSKKQLYKVYLNITNPLEISEFSKGAISDEVFRRIMARGNYEWGMAHTDIDKLLRYNTLDSDRLAEMVKVFNGEEILTVMKEELGYNGVHYTDRYGDIWVAWDKSQIKNTTNQAPTSSTDIRYSDRVTDQETLDFLENQEHVTVYRAMQVIDGKLYPPMNAYTYDENGKKVLMPPSEIGAWEQSVERPDLIDPKTGKFKLDKGKVDSGKRGTAVPAAYNPYIHTSLSMLNDQFTSAYQRSNLVVVKGVVPKSELTSGYRAQYAKDTVGETEWHSGVVSTQLPESRKVILSRWFKPVEIMSDDAVAKGIKKMLGDTGVEIPYNVVSPKLRRSLEKIGVPIGEGRGIRNLPAKSEVKYDDRDHFVEDKYFRTQMAKWEDLKHGSYVKVGQIGEKHPLHSVGMPTGVLRYDVDKLKRNMDDHGDYLSVELLKAIPDIIANPVAISEYSEENTVSVFGDVFVGNSPMMVGVTISRDRAGNDISKVRTFNARRDVGNLITDDTVLYLGEDKKRTRKWFQACGIQVPLGETRFGFIRSISQKSDFVKRKFSDRDSYAPVFYSHMGKTIDDIKIAKMGAGGVVPYLKGRGVKDEEIKWSGIEAFLEGKKSVTKEELQEFVAGSQLQIVEQMSGEGIDLRYNGSDRAYTLYDSNGEAVDTFTYNEFLDGYVSDSDEEVYSNEIELREALEEAYGATSSPKWEQYKLDGGSNYRELVFQMPNSTYSNRAMRGHWGQDAEGILVHARIQDMNTSDGKMLFVEELQSDWHNEGHAKGYSTVAYEDAVESSDKLYNEYKKVDLAFHKYVRSNEFMTDPEDVRKKKHDWLRGKVDAAYDKYLKAKAVVDSLKQDGAGDTPDAPFRDTYHEYVMKRLIRMAAEEGYDIIGWTPSEIQVDRWSEDYAEGYRIEYDQDIPKFLRKYGKKWGATVGKTSLEGNGEVTYTSGGMKYKSIREWYDATKEAIYLVYGDHLKGKLTVKEDGNTMYVQNKETGERYADKLTVRSGDTEVWSMPITDSMKQSVLREGQPLYSDRSDSDISNRELLANAMEAAATNDIERNKLAQYKQKIALINAEEQKLHELKAQIGELSFAKGKKDVEQIRKLQFEAKQCENRINTYDRQLLSLEASAPLKAVLEREKKLAYKKAEQRGKDALAAYREKAAADKRKLLERAAESRKKGIEGRRKTEMRHKIKKVVSDLDQLLRHGSKDRNVKLGLQAAVASALEAVNMDTIAADERIAKLEKELMQAKTPEKIQEISRKIDHIRDQGDRMASRLEELRRAYADIKNSDQGVPDYYKNEASLIADKVDSVMKKVGDTPLRNMSLSQLDEVYNLYKIVLTTVRNVNSLFVQGKLDDLHQNASAIMQEEEAIKPLKEERLAIGDWWRKQAWNEMIPVYAFERLGSKTLTKFFWETIKGQNTFATDVAEAKEFSKAAREKFGYAKWDLDKIHEFNLEDGRTLRVTLRHMMSIYAYSKREQALDHMRVGGFFFNDKNTFRKEKGILKVIKSNEAGYTISEDVFQAISAAMTKEQIQYVDEMQDYLTKMGAKGNEVSRVLWGIDIFKEKVYFPLKSSHDFIYQANQPTQESSLKNDGMTKETIPHASNPIVLEEFDDVWASHIERMSKYHSFVLPIENLNKLMNYGTWVGTDSVAVSTMIRARHSDAANEYITQFIRDLNGASSMDGVSNPVFGFFNKFKKTAVAASLSVVVQQPTAILRASAVLDPKYFVGKPSLKSLPSKWEELQKYAPIAIIKDIGGFDAGGGRQIAEWLNADTKRGLEKVMGKVDDITMLGAALGDQVGWTAIWEAVKRETLHNNPKLSPKSEEFLKLAGERFTEVIVLTQVYDSTLSRSGFMRSKHESVKMMTSFMGEPTVSFNMLMDAVMQAKGKKITKRQAARTVGAVYASVVAAAVAASMIYALRDDDDDEAYLEKLAESLSGKLKDEINPLNMLPIMRDIISIMDGWDVERTDVAIFKDLKDAFDGLSSENKSAWRKVEDFAGAIASTLGVPLKNVLRTGREIYNLFENIFDSDAPTGAGIKDAIAAGITGKEKSNGQQLYEAILNGDQKQIERVKGRFDNQKAIDTALRKAIRENDPRVKEAAQAIIDEDFSKYTKLANEMVNEGYFSEANIVAAIKSEINAMTEDEDETEETEDKEVSIYEMDYFYSAVVGGDTVMAHAIREDIIRTKVANGKDREDAEKNFNSSFASRCREEYEAGSLSDSEAVRMLVSYGGKTETEAQAKVQYWDFKQGNPDTYVSEY